MAGPPPPSPLYGPRKRVKVGWGGAGPSRDEEAGWSLCERCCTCDSASPSAWKRPEGPAWKATWGCWFTFGCSSGGLFTWGAVMTTQWARKGQHARPPEQRIRCFSPQ